MRRDVHSDDSNRQTRDVHGVPSVEGREDEDWFRPDQGSRCLDWRRVS